MPTIEFYMQLPNNGRPNTMGSKSIKQKYNDIMQSKQDNSSHDNGSPCYFTKVLHNHNDQVLSHTFHDSFINPHPPIFMSI